MPLIAITIFFSSTKSGFDASSLNSEIILEIDRSDLSMDISSKSNALRIGPSSFIVIMLEKRINSLVQHFLVISGRLVLSFLWLLPLCEG